VLLQLCAVYLFEYVAQGCAAKVRPKIEYNIGCPELYAGLSLCYQVTIHTLPILPGDNPYSPYATRWQSILSLLPGDNSYSFYTTRWQSILSLCYQVTIHTLLSTRWQSILSLLPGDNPYSPSVRHKLVGAISQRLLQIWTWNFKGA